MSRGKHSLPVTFDASTPAGQEKLKNFALGFPPGCVSVEQLVEGAYAAIVHPGGALGVGK